MSDAEAEPFGGYRFAISRSFWVTGQDLVVERSWRKGSHYRPIDQILPDTFITGKAQLRTDDVSVIGRDNRTNVFNLSITSNEFVKEDWERHKANYNAIVKLDGSTPELRLISMVQEKLDEDPPTAVLLFYEADAEYGISEDGWTLECKVTPETLHSLATDIAKNRLFDLYILINWAAGLVFDQHAHPRFSTNWGLIEPEGMHSPEPLRGHVSGIGWKSIDKSISQPSAAPSAKEQDPQSRETDKFSQLDQALSTHLARLYRIVTITLIASVLFALVTSFLR